jgi:hypothetical protein
MQDLKTQLPERINAMKVISYDVQQIAETLMAEQELEAHEITLEMVIERIESWVEEDFANQGNFSDVIFQDENGEEIDA